MGLEGRMLGDTSRTRPTQFLRLRVLLVFSNSSGDLVSLR